MCRTPPYRTFTQYLSCRRCTQPFGNSPPKTAWACLLLWNSSVAGIPTLGRKEILLSQLIIACDFAYTHHMIDKETVHARRNDCSTVHLHNCIFSTVTSWLPPPFSFSTSQTPCYKASGPPCGNNLGQWVGGMRGLPLHTMLLLHKLHFQPSHCLLGYQNPFFQ